MLFMRLHSEPGPLYELTSSAEILKLALSTVTEHEFVSLAAGSHYKASAL